MLNPYGVVYLPENRCKVPFYFQDKPVGWVEERRHAVASRRVTQHPKKLVSLGFTPFHPTYINFSFSKVTKKG